VMSADGSRVYFALQDVPPGIQLDNVEYWICQIDLSKTKSDMDAAIDTANAIAANVKTDIAQLSDEIADASAINDGAISPVKTNFFDEVLVTPTNLLDMSKVSKGAYLAGNGKLTDNASYDTTDFLPVKPGDVLRYQAAVDVGYDRFDLETSPSYGSLRFAALYDEDKNFISGTYTQNVKTVQVNVNNARYCRISISTSLTNRHEVMIFSGTSATIIPYTPYFEPYTEYKLKEEYEYTEKVTAFIPPEVCVTENRTIEMYNQQILPNAKKYHFVWDTKYSSYKLGRGFARKASFEGAWDWCNGKVVAPITLAIYDDNMDVLWNGSTTLKYALALSSPKTICCIGDSLTNGKAWLAEIINLSGGNLSLVGTKQFSVKDADGNTRTGYHEGRSGWTAARYNQPGDSAPDEASYKYVNPFYNAAVGHFDWNYYVTNSLGGTSPDAVMLWLGTNGIALDPTANAEAIKTLVDYIRADDADIPIFLAYTIYPGNQDALGAQTSSDGYAANSGAWQYEEYKKVLNLCIKLTELMGDYTNLHFVPLATCHDSEYNYGSVETPVNPRAAQTVDLPIEAVHPQAQGYYQIADVVFSSLSVHLAD